MNGYSVGGRIRRLRLDLGLSQEQLALKANVTPAYLGQIERDERNPTIKVVEKISRVFGLSLAAFFGGQAEVYREESDVFEKKLLFEVSNLSARDKQSLLSIVEQIVKMATAAHEADA